MKPKPITAYAIVNKKKPKINIFYIFKNRSEVNLDKGEKIIKVYIMSIEDSIWWGGQKAKRRKLNKQIEND